MNHDDDSAGRPTESPRRRVADGGRTHPPGESGGDQDHDHDTQDESSACCDDAAQEDATACCDDDACETTSSSLGEPAGEPAPREAVTDDEGQTVTLSVPSMDCPSCAGKVTKSVEKQDGVLAIDARPTMGTLSVTFDPDRTDESAVVERVEAAGYDVERRTDLVTERLDVPAMDCPSCAGKVEKAVGKVAGIAEAEFRPTTGTVEVRYDPDETSHDAIVRAIEGAGYDVVGGERDDDGHSHGASASGDETSVWRTARAKQTWVSGAFLALGVVLQFFLPALDLVVGSLVGLTLHLSDVFLLAGTVAGGRVIVRNGYYSAKNLNLDIDFLMTAAILAALAVSPFAGEDLFVEAASLAFLFNVAELLERRSVERARNSLSELMDLSPDVARVRRDGEEQEVPVDEVEVGETVLVKSGEKIPMDGVVRAGESAVDESPITGESVPVDKSPGAEVFAGTIAQGGYLEVETTGAAGENTIAKVIEMVEDAQANKTEREQFVERFSGYYTPVVVVLALLTAFVPPLVLSAPWEPWFLRGISFLVIACPCAFVISTPVTVVSGVTSAAKNGVLVKGGDRLEAMGDIEAIAYDKTGTLTRGELVVTDVIPVGDHSEEDVLRCAHGLETRSEHPIGEAIVSHASENGADHDAVESFESLTGKGVRAELGGVPHVAGKPDYFTELGFDLSHVHVADVSGELAAETHERCERAGCLDLVNDTIPRLQNQGKTVILVGTEDELEGVVAVADEVREEARRTVERLRELGVAHQIMLTGDNEGTAAAVAADVGVDEFRAELLPEDKVAAVEELLEEYGTVAMVGDGVNDAPALATATVGIAMGAAGTDTALETADIALLGDDLSKLPYLYDLSRSANGVIRQNVWGSLGVKALLAIGIPLGYVTVVVAILAGDVGMTTLVTGNAMRLSRLKPDEE
jgi:Cd2+/Zn2+-exporting ATPase